MGDLSKDFSRSEFACKCGCGLDDVNPALITVLQSLRDWWRRPVTINSGCRCYDHNETVQKKANPNYIANSSKSQHMLCTAADIVVKGISAGEVSRHLDIQYPNQYGIGSYDSFTHIDVRQRKARW
jgi:uncharacterized protein YcbK (DUF882 family)